MRLATFSSRAATALAAALVLAGSALPARAQSYPSKPIRLVVPFPAGGGTDFFARTVGNKMSEQMGQPIIVDNRPGAGSIIGAQAAVTSPADGYTILLGDMSTLAVNPSLYKKLPYDPQKDFAPVTLTARFAMLLVVNPDKVRANTARELVQLVKATPGMNYATVSAGTAHHLTMELFKQQAGVSLEPVHYKGAAPAIQDLVGGQVPVMFLDLAAGGPQIRAGRLKVLGVASAKPIPAMPEVPTIASTGVPGFEAGAWQAFVVPVGTPRDIIARLNAEFAKAVADPGVRQRLMEGGIEPVTSTPEEAAAHIRSETIKWAQVIKHADIKVE
jgi:tripartite-type tricarboxylate transporter receptor subunit TctC